MMKRLPDEISFPSSLREYLAIPSNSVEEARRKQRGSREGMKRKGDNDN